jgi:DNA mismatch repair protein MSH6
MFHMDADIGVEVCNLSYMKGHVAHAGFPEISYGPMADKLVQAGYKVARVEQTETPDQLKARKAKAPKHLKKTIGSVVNREVCSIVSLGTRTFCALDDAKVLAQLDSINATSSGGPLLTISEVLVEETATDDGDGDGDGDGDENDDQVRPVCEYGITLVDAVRGTVTVGQFADDVLRSRMNTLLARLAPSEILLPDTASPVLKGLIQTFTRSAHCRMETVHSQEPSPQSTALDPHHRRQLERPTAMVQPWNVDEFLTELHRKAYYPRGSKKQSGDDNQSIRRWPAVLQALVQGEASLALASFGAALYYLQRHLVDHEILSMGVVKAYIPEASTNLATTANQQHYLGDTAHGDAMEEDPTSTSAAATDPAGASAGLASISPPVMAEDQISYLSLDGTTLHNLEILTNAVDHKVAGSLWSKINYCKSPHGARFLRAWLLRPLFRKADIDRRANAVQELTAGAGAVALGEARQQVLGQVGDLDRLLSRIHSMSGNTGTESEDGGGSYHPSDRAVLYENATYTKRKVNDFSKLLSGLRKACQIPELFADLQLDPNGLLFKLVRLQSPEGGCFPDMAENLDWYFENFDCSKAAKGLFEPCRGVDEAFDQACDTIDRIQADLEDFKQELCQELSPRHVALRAWTYINTKPESKDKYLIELPASVQVPDDFLVKGKRGSGAKQINKYRTPEVARLVQELEHAFEVQQERRAKGMQLIFAKFDSQRSLWRAAAQATGMLDALNSLAKVASKPGFCRPTILDCPLDQPPVIDIVQGRHPCVEGSSIHTTEFIPNDLRLGGNPEESSTEDKARLLLLSGPNMGGKSTLLRQTCLITILAQMGCYVPAESCSLTPVDCIYTRLGASDRILLGQSTFFVELAETAAALRGATRRSLVIMDELGRGTSTFDGTAIAGATVKHLIERSQCLSLFATHYHSLLDEWQNEPMVRLGHMQCMVEEEDSAQENSDHSITFLYTLGPGTCPKSFGINVARLASLPAEVLANAKRVSEEFEEEMADAHSNNSTAQKEQIVAAIQSGDWDEVERLWNEVKK